MSLCSEWMKSSQANIRDNKLARKLFNEVNKDLGEMMKQGRHSEATKIQIENGGLQRLPRRTKTADGCESQRMLKTEYQRKQAANLETRNSYLMWSLTAQKEEEKVLSLKLNSLGCNNSCITQAFVYMKLQKCLQLVDMISRFL